MLTGNWTNIFSSIGSFLLGTVCTLYSLVFRLDLVLGEFLTHGGFKILTVDQSLCQFYRKKRTTKKKNLCLLVQYVSTVKNKRGTRSL